MKLSTRSLNSWASSSRLMLSSPALVKKCQMLLPLLENLCQFEEAIVRDAACKSLTAIADSLPEEDVINLVVPCLLRLAEGTWFTNRVSSLTVMGGIYEKTGEWKATIRKYFPLIQEIQRVQHGGDAND